MSKEQIPKLLDNHELGRQQLTTKDVTDTPRSKPDFNNLRSECYPTKPQPATIRQYDYRPSKETKPTAINLTISSFPLLPRVGRGARYPRTDYRKDRRLAYSFRLACLGRFSSCIAEQARSKDRESGTSPFS
jgi:hypothetical protein